jgi:hypothetical protein
VVIIKSIDLVNSPNYNLLFTPEIKSIIITTNVLKRGKNKKEVNNDLWSMIPPSITQRCSTISLFKGILINKLVQ